MAAINCRLPFSFIFESYTDSSNVSWTSQRVTRRVNRGRVLFVKVMKMLWCSIGAFHSKLLLGLVLENVRKFIGCHMVVHVSMSSVSAKKAGFRQNDVKYNPNIFV